MKQSHVGKRMTVERFSDRVRLVVNFNETQLRIIEITLLVLTLCLIGYIDYLVPSNYYMFAFYLLPTGIASWCLNRIYGFIAVGISLALIITPEILLNGFTDNLMQYIWNNVMILALLVMMVIIFDRLKAYLGDLRISVNTDHLTGAMDAKIFYDNAGKELEMARRYERPLTLAYLDVDNFKMVNDKYGHIAGDELLQKVSYRIKSSMREGDLLGRMGGDEFAIMLPETDPQQGYEIINRLRNILSETFSHNGCPVSFSIGLTTFYKHKASIDEIIQRVDELMYKAKSAGKNQIVQEIT